jgi:hypothetical protein
MKLNYYVPGLSETFLCGESEELTPSNPFLESQQKESALDLALQELQVRLQHINNNLISNTP